MENKIKCLIIDEMHESILPLLHSIGVEADYMPAITPAQVIAIIQSYQGIMVRSKMNLDKNFFEKATSLKFIARAGAGMDKIDLAEAKHKNITLLNAPEGNANALAEHALGLLLNLINNINRSHAEVSQLKWDREGNRGYELDGKCAAIIGYGHMGKAFAKKLHLLGCKVIAYDKFQKNFSDEYATEVSLETLWNQSDIVSIHIPFDLYNHYFIGHDFLNHFSKPIWFLNTSRGEVLQTSALIEALLQGKVMGAGLDVLENEKLNTLTENQAEDLKSLMKLPQVILTPHIGGWTVESYQKINEVLVEKIKKFKLDWQR